MGLRRRVHRMTKTQIAEAERLYAEGYSCESIGEEFGFSDSAIWNKVRKAGLIDTSPTPVLQPSTVVEDSQPSVAVQEQPATVDKQTIGARCYELFNQGVTDVEEVARITGFKLSTIKAYLHTHKRLHAPAVTFTADALRKFATLYNPPSFQSIGSIAKELSMSIADAKQTLHKARQAGLIKN